MAESDDEGSGLGLFEEPKNFFKPEAEPTFAEHTLRSGTRLSLRLVGNNPLWGHLLWNAGRTLAEFLEENADLYVKDRNVLELGAGAGLPSLTSYIIGAKHVVVTDYPDADLIQNLMYNIEHNPVQPDSKGATIEAQGYLWGADVQPLKAILRDGEQEQGFQTLILADLLFNHSEHQKLVQTVEHTLARTEDAYALVFFTPYRPWLLEKDLAFFDTAKAAGFEVEKIFEKLMDQVMFKEDPGDETLRRTVFGYRLSRRS